MPRSLRQALGLFFLVRLPWVLLSWATLGVIPMGRGSGGMPVDGPGWANVWLRWDSAWYVRAAVEGYSASNCLAPGPQCQQATISFLPSFPLALRGLIGAGFSVPTASFLINHLCIVLALWGLIEASRWYGKREPHTHAAWALLVYPTTLFFSAGYAESMFAAASIWAWLFWLRGSPISAGVALSVAALSRPYGVVFVACLLGVGLVRRRWRPVLIAGAICGATFAVFVIWQHLAFGDPLAFLHARRAWGFGQTEPLETLKSYWARAAPGGDIPWQGRQDFLAIPILFAGSVWCFRRLGPELGLFCLSLFLLPLSQGQVWSMSRAALGAFPLFLMLGSVASRWRTPIFAVSFACASINAMLFVNGVWIA